MRKMYDSGGPVVDLYDLRTVDAPGMPFHGDVAFYLRQAHLTGGPVLDLACGTGRVSLPLAKAGFEVVGLDLSRFMLEIAKRKAASLSVSRHPEFVHGSMERFDLGRRFRLALIPFRSFQHLLTPEAQRRSLECIRRHLRPGGRLIVNLFDPRLEFCLPVKNTASMERESMRDPRTGHVWKILIRDRRNDPATQTFRETWVWKECRGKRVVRTLKDVLQLRWTYAQEMRHLFELTGYRVRGCYGDFQRGPARYGVEQIWVVDRVR